MLVLLLYFSSVELNCMHNVPLIRKVEHLCFHCPGGVGEAHIKSFVQGDYLEKYTH